MNTMKENYYIKIIEIYSDFIKISNKEVITPKDVHNFNRIRGVIFEYIAAIYYNVLRYDDIKTSIKEALNLPKSDFDRNSAGIDLLDYNNKVIYQCKNYTTTTLTPNNLGTFFASMNRMGPRGFTGIISISESTKILNLQNLVNITIDVLNNVTTQQIFADAYYFVKCLSRKQSTEIILRDYQIEILDLIDKHNNYAFQLPCGTGKSVIIAEYINKHPEKRIAVFTPSIYLANEMCKLINYPVNRIFSDRPTEENYNTSVVVYDSWKKLQNDYDILFVDEAHHYENNAHKMKSCKIPRKYLFSATLENYDYKYTYQQAIDNDYIVDCNINVHYCNYINYQMAADILNKYLEYRHVIVYCNNKADCKKLTLCLQKNNILAKCVHSDMSQSEIIENIEEFKNGLLRVIVNCFIIDEGVDIKNCETAFFYENRNSKVQIIQCVGRTQRMYNGKSTGNVVCLVTNDDNRKTMINNYLTMLSDEEHGFNNMCRLKLYNETIVYNEYGEEDNKQQ